MNKSHSSIFERSKKGRIGYILKDTGIDYEIVLDQIDSRFLRESPPKLPEVSENIAVRHFTNLSRRNYGVDNGIYPLGSCTMKYNPKINEYIANLEAINKQHPDWPHETMQGSLALLYELQMYLQEITGMDAVSLEPSAGSQGELTGLMIIKKYHQNHNNHHKNVIIIPDSAHGTNPASVTMAGFETVEVASNEEGTIDLEALDALISDNVAGLMLTNPNTLGLFEKDITKIAKRIHDVGGLLYYDGANMNANLGITRPAEMGFDIVHLNLHKTFSTPHGGGGPGSGPVGVTKELESYLPAPIITLDNGMYKMYNPELSIGKVKQYFGNFGVLVRAYVYIRVMGKEGLKKASEYAVLNANYMMKRLSSLYKVPYNMHCKHEFVLEGLKEAPEDITTLDVAKRLIDYGVHPPTIYFPLIVEQALMIEPTESEPLESIDEYIDIFLNIAKEAKENPELLKEAPTQAPVRRLDEVGAARKPVITYDFELE